MGFALDQVVPWGRSYDEYVRMFDLGAVDLGRRILGCGDGPAAFNAELSRRGGSVVSIDPVYGFSAAQIRSRIAETYELVMAQMRMNQADYVWESIPNLDRLGALRMAAMEAFLADFDAGREAGRYLVGALPSLPFDPGAFDLALSSHFLFLYSEALSADFHLAALDEMLRAAREVRVFPLLTLNGVRSPHLPAVADQCAARGLAMEIRRVPYEFQRGGDEMLVIRSG